MTKPKKETGNKMSSIASKAMREPNSLSNRQIRQLGASVLSQDETKGKRK